MYGQRNDVSGRRAPASGSDVLEAAGLALDEVARAEDAA